MPAPDDFIIGPIAGVYVGIAGNTDQLIEMGDTRTQGGRYKYNKPCQFEVGAGDDCQSDLCTVSMDLTFYWSEQACIVAMTNDPTDNTVNIDDPPSGQHYSVLLLASDPDTKASIYLGECVSKCSVENPFLKTDGTTLPVSFLWWERNKFVKIQNRGTYAELAAILGDRWPAIGTA